MNATFFNGDILKKEALDKNERITLGGSAQCKCYLYDSSTQSYDELQDYEVAKAADRKYWGFGEKKSYREVFFVYTGVNRVTLRFDDRRPQRNFRGYWACKHYELEFKIRVEKPKEVIRRNVLNVNTFIASYDNQIKALVVRCETGGELRIKLNKIFQTNGLTLDHVSVRTEETNFGLSSEQLDENKRLNNVVEEYHKNKVTDIQGNGRREQQKKDALNQLDIDKQKLTLKYTEKQVALNQIFDTLQRLNIRNQEKAKAIAMLAEILGIGLSPHIVRLLNKPKRNQALVDLP